MKGNSEMIPEKKNCSSSHIFFFIFLWLVSITSAESLETTVTTSNVTTTTIAIASEAPPLKTAETNDDTIGSPLPTAAKLVRYRRQPPYTIIKHVVRTSKQSRPRRRMKRPPKIRYGRQPPPPPPPPPSYVYEDQSSVFKQPTSHSTLPDMPTYHFDEFSSLNLNAADFELPSTSYETQSMELDFYHHGNGHSHSHTEGEKSYQNIPKFHEFEPSIEPTYSKKPKFHAPPSTEYVVGHEFEPSIEPTYSKKLPYRKPHQKYGVPKNLEYSTDFNVNSGYYSPSATSGFEPSLTDYSLYNAYQPESIGHPSPSGRGSNGGTPQYKPTSIGKHLTSVEYNNFQSHSSRPTPSPTYHIEPAPPTSPDDYAIYNTHKTNTEWGQNYNEHETVQHTLPPPTPLPPETQPTQSVAEIDITYSPSFEINLPHSPSNDVRQYDSINTAHIQPGNFAEPPEHPHPPTTAHFNSEPTNEQPFPGPGPVDYVTPAQELPLNPHHKQPAYDFPKSSYEVPIYDPIPFEASTIDEQEYYPPNQFEHIPQSPPQSSPQPLPASPPTNLFTHSHSHQNNLESHPPEAHTPQPPYDSHTLETDASTSTSTTKKLGRNRKRQRPHPAVVDATKHILDVPELKEAFEAGRPTKYAHYSSAINADTEVNASDFFEEKHKITTSSTTPHKNTENYINSDWNPKRIRTTTSLNSQSFQSTAASSSKATVILPNSKQTAEQYYNKQLKTKFRPKLRPLLIISNASSPSPMQLSSYQKQQTSAKTPPIISIEKSQSKSYYDGTLAPSALKITNASKVTEKPNTQETTTTAKRKIKSIFDTTYFKAPQNNNWTTSSGFRPSNQFDLNFPKNHKLY